MEFTVFKDLVVDNRKIHEIKDFIEIQDCIRIYYIDKKNGNGFVAYVIERISTWNYRGEQTPKDPWAIDRCDVECMMHIEAYFDGLRHLYIGDEGYVYCPNIVDITNALNVLDELTERYCQKV